MIKTKIVETTEKYDENGKIVERIIREETTEDDETRYPVQYIPPFYNTPNIIPPTEITCNTNHPYTINCSSKCKCEEK